MFTRPGPTELLCHGLRNAHLDDDLSIKVFADIKIEKLVGRSGKAVGALMEASAHLINGPAEAHITGGRDLIERTLGEHFVEPDAVELWRVRGAHKVIEAHRNTLLTFKSGAAGGWATGGGIRAVKKPACERTPQSHGRSLGFPRVWPR
jgi:hypothetical protein